jgi:hypothetical protein
MLKILKFIREDENYLYVQVHVEGIVDEMRIEKLGGRFLPSVTLTQLLAAKGGKA